MKGSQVGHGPGPYDLPDSLFDLTPPPAWFQRAVSGEPPPAAATGPPLGKPKLLARIREAIRIRQYSPRTEQAYVEWVKRYVFFHKLRHPAEMGPQEIQAFLSDLAVRGHVSASTQNQALCALIFMYKYVLAKEVGFLDGLIRAKRPLRLPVVLTPERSSWCSLTSRASSSSSPGCCTGQACGCSNASA